MTAPHDLSDRAYRVAIELESRAHTWESIGRLDLGAKDRHHAAVLHELVGALKHSAAAQAEAARAIAESVRSQCAAIADRKALEYAEAARMSPPGATGALGMASAAEAIGREIRATGRVTL